MKFDLKVLRESLRNLLPMKGSFLETEAAGGRDLNIRKRSLKGGHIRDQLRDLWRINLRHLKRPPLTKPRPRRQLINPPNLPMRLRSPVTNLVKQCMNQPMMSTNSRHFLIPISPILWPVLCQISTLISTKSTVSFYFTLNLIYSNFVTSF